MTLRVGTVLSTRAYFDIVTLIHSYVARVLPDNGTLHPTVNRVQPRLVGKMDHIAV